MSAMETTFTVRTDTDNDAMQVPHGIETVVVNDSAERVIVPPGVQIIRLQTGQGGGGGGGGGGHVRSRSPDSPDRYGDMIDELIRAKRSTGTSTGSQNISRAPAMTEKSLSLPSCPPTPPGSRSAGTDAPDFHSASRPPPVAETVAETAPVAVPVAVPEPLTTPITTPASEPVSPPSAPTEEAPPRDIFDDRTLEVDRKRIINQQPATTAPTATVGNGRLVRYAGETEGEMHDPLVHHGSAKMRKLDSFGWREEFERGEKESKPTIQKFGRAVADILCCWMGV